MDWGGPPLDVGYNDELRHARAISSVIVVPTEAPAAAVSVVICTYTEERYDDLRRAIASVRAQSVAVREVVVAVDRNQELLRRVEAEFPTIVAVANSQHPGAGGARNSGVAAATGSILAFIDDDVEVEHDWLERLLPPMSDPRVLGVGGAIEPAWATKRPYWFPAEFDWVVGCTYRGMPTKIARVRNAISANMAVKREVFEAVGGFRAGFGKQGSVSEPEETEFCIRAASACPDRSWLFVPGAVVHHRVTPERETWRYFLMRCRNEGIGKARMSGHVQAEDALDTERQYVTRTLPVGVLRGFTDTLRGRPGGLRRSAAIIIGVAVTTLVYVADLGRQRLSSLRAGRFAAWPSPPRPA